jgi:hypothetical protein
MTVNNMDMKKKRKKREDSLVGRGCIAKKEHQTVYLIIIK